MKKLMCIDDWSYTKEKIHQYLRFGEIYYSSKVCRNADGEKCYLLPGFPSTTTDTGRKNLLPLYKCDRFFELSDLDEIEIHKNKYQ